MSEKTGIFIQPSSNFASVENDVFTLYYSTYRHANNPSIDGDVLTFNWKDTRNGYSWVGYKRDYGSLFGIPPYYNNASNPVISGEHIVYKIGTGKTLLAPVV